MAASEIEIAWAAGLFEGEGCFSIVKPREPVAPDSHVAEEISHGVR